jgi:hypothetical protein
MHATRPNQQMQKIGVGRGIGKSPPLFVATLKFCRGSQRICLTHNRCLLLNTQSFGIPSATRRRSTTERYLPSLDLHTTQYPFLSHQLEKKTRYIFHHGEYTARSQYVNKIQQELDDIREKTLLSSSAVVENENTDIERLTATTSIKKTKTRKPPFSTRTHQLRLQ